MVRSLAKDKLKYSSTQLDDLSDKLRLGDLTPLLQIYEDIKGVRSGFSGTLLRSALIQFQKARVCPAFESFSLCNYSLRLTLTWRSRGSISSSSHKSSHSHLSAWGLHYHWYMLWVVICAGSSRPEGTTWVAGGGGEQRHG